MAKEATLQVRMDSEMKERVEALYQRMGTTFAEGVRMFAAQSLMIDANVILRHLLRDVEDQSEQARIVIAGGAYTTAEVLAEVVYVLHGVYQVPLSILDTTGLDCKKALLSPISDYKDAIMTETALRADVDCVITRNTRAYTQSRIKVLLPSEFLTVLNHEE